MLKKRMKALAAVCCLWLLWAAVLPAWAEDPTDPDTESSLTGTQTSEKETKPSAGEAEPTGKTTEPTATETEPTATETEFTATETEPSDPQRIRTFISLLIEGEELCISVTDETGEPVPQAPLALYLDGEIVTLTADEEGTVRYAMQQRPVQISCTMPPFGEYESASSSVVLQPEDPPLESETDPQPTETAPTSRRPTAAQGTTVTRTARDPDEGKATVTEIIPAPTAVPTEEPAPVTVAVEVNKYPRSTARTLIILGTALLIAAALTVYLFLAYAPREEAEPEEEVEEPEKSDAEKV